MRGRQASRTPRTCAGVRKNREDGRDVYVEDEAFQAVWNLADEPTRDAMDLMYLSGQRPADVLTRRTGHP